MRYVNNHITYDDNNNPKIKAELRHTSWIDILNLLLMNIEILGMVICRILELDSDSYIFKKTD